MWICTIKMANYHKSSKLSLEAQHRHFGDLRKFLFVVMVAILDAEQGYF
jgi:hypothetical protein